ncbi:MAG: hypothetical protein EOO22_26240 [Comamonadaceae bacterium]|nr:MAG: hypothetical protein EOO22_26240 [Comamonadaceae bacterium]
MTYDAFTAEFEAAGDTDFAQLLHTGETHGHAINRGDGRSAGYALSLDAEHAAVDPAVGSSPVSDGDARLGLGTSLTRNTSEKNGRRYDLAQLSGFVEAPQAPAGDAAMAPMPGERVVLDDWPYIDGPSGRTQAGVAIDWQYRNGAVGEVAIAPIEGQVLDGWTAKVLADITLNGSTVNRANLKIRVTTTFSRAGEDDQVAVTDVMLSGDGRPSTIHGANLAPEPGSNGNDAAHGEAASDSMQPQLVTA